MAVCCARFGLTKNRNRRRAEGFGLMLVISHTVCGPHPYTRTIHHPRQPPIRWIRGWVHVLANHDTNIKGSTSHKGTRICGARTSESVALPKKSNPSPPQLWAVPRTCDVSPFPPQRTSDGDRDRDPLSCRRYLRLRHPPTTGPMMGRAEGCDGEGRISRRQAGEQRWATRAAEGQ
ncbi:hypothetical protein BHM03_00055678, partial [Ensete ventricosum]